MKALVLNLVGRGFDFEDVEIATPIGREALVNVQAAGLCHTDLLFATHDIAPTPAVLGHEVAGIVAAVGPDVAQIRVGDHVVGSLAQSCGACARCLSGHPFQCKYPMAASASSSLSLLCKPIYPAGHPTASRLPLEGWLPTRRGRCTWSPPTAVSRKK